MARLPIREAFSVFVHDGDTAIGAVRQVPAEGDEFLIDVENAGEFWISYGAVRDVFEDKVVLDGGKLDPALRRAIGHAHDAEDPFAADRPLPGEND